MISVHGKVQALRVMNWRLIMWGAEQRARKCAAGAVKADLWTGHWRDAEEPGRFPPFE